MIVLLYIIETISVLSILFLLYKHIFSNADTRSPFIISGLLCTFMYVFICIKTLKTGQADAYMFYFSFMYPGTILSILLFSRLMGYNSSVLKTSLKSVIYAIFITILPIILIWKAYKFNSSEIFIINNINDFFAINEINLINTYNTISMNIWLIFVYIICILNTVFDIIEKRTISNHIINGTSFIYFIIILIRLFVKIDNVFFVTISEIFIFLMPIVAIYKEFISILRNTRNVDFRINSITKTLIKINSLKEYNSLESYQLKLVRKMIEEDDELRKELTNRKKYKKFMNNLKMIS